MSIYDAIQNAAASFAAENVRPVKFAVVLSRDEYAALLSMRTPVLVTQVAPLLQGVTGGYAIVQTACGPVDVHEQRPGTAELMAQVPAALLSEVMREILELDEAWTSAPDEHQAKVSMATVRKCAALMRATESAHVLGGDDYRLSGDAMMGRVLLDQATGTLLDKLAEERDVVRHGSNVLEDDDALRARLLYLSVTR